jgi:hypothetical protein
MKSARLWVAGVVMAGLGFGMARASSGVEPAEAPAERLPGQLQACNLNIDNWNVTRSDLTYHAPYFESTLTIRVRVDPESCSWKIDNSQKPSWINLAVSGNSIGGGYFRGPAVIDVRMAKNSGYGRSGRVKFVTSTYALPVDFGQANYTGACPFKPEGATPGGWKVVTPGFLAVTQSMSMPANNFRATIVDKSTCPLSPRPHAYTFGMTGATIQATGVPRTYLINRSGVPRNTTGEGALFVMSQPGFAAFGAVLAQELPMPAALPPELQVTMSLDKSFLSFADGGGVVRIGGSVKRLVSTPTKPCLFAPGYFTVMAASSSGPWLSVSPESTCNPGNPNSGTLVITALPNGPNARVGAIFTAWGNVIFVVQPAS